jgi:hypothetical protein
VVDDIHPDRFIVDTSIPYNDVVQGSWMWNGDASGLGWRTLIINLSPFAGSIQISVAMISDGNMHYPGAYIDNLRIIHIDP